MNCAIFTLMAMHESFFRRPALIFAMTFGLFFWGCELDSDKPLNKVKWIHGSADCAKNSDPRIQVYRYDSNTWILRQNKCVHYEAPFMFLFVGSNKALLMDTGATEDDKQFPLFEVVNKILRGWEEEHATSLELVVAHTHKHSDHRAADKQFLGKPQTTVVGLSLEEVVSFFHFENWPTQSARIDLGNRKLEIIAIPGHDPVSIAIYDYQTKLLLTGDTFYPGRLYVRDWAAFKESIHRLYEFTTNHEITYLLGNHIEMTTTPGKDYAVETTYQPAEHILPLTVQDLKMLDRDLRLLGDNPVKKVYDHFIVYPVK